MRDNGMNRLTFKAGGFNAFNDKKMATYGCIQKDGSIIYIGDVADKLAKYEDLEEQGKLPLLHVGDTIYFIVFGHNEATGKYEDYIQHETITSVFITKDLLSYTTESKGFASSEIGKSVFVTEKEAKVVLKQRN